MIDFAKINNFYTSVRTAITGAEAYEPLVYDDGLGIPTIGYGYALIVKNKDGDWEIRETLVADLGAQDVGYPLNRSGFDSGDVDVLVSIADALNKNQISLAQDLIGQYSFQIILDESQADALFQLSLSRAQTAVESQLKRHLGDKRGAEVFAALENTREFVALTSLAYNLPALIGENLTKALYDGNRAEAWYEIRYDSNKGSLDTNISSVIRGLAKRRYYESEIFGLYDNTDSVSVDEAGQAYRIFNAHRDKILAYEARFGVTPDGTAGSEGNMIFAANRDFNTTILPTLAVQSLEAAFTPAEQTLKDFIATEAGTTPEIQAALNLISFVDIQTLEDAGGKLEGNHRTDTAFGTGPARDDLLIGGASTDVLSGGDGRDVLYGGAEADRLDGGAGNDYLIGGSGVDTLVGGKGDDILDGGAGNDIYVYNAGDGLDRIRDQGDNTLIFNGTPIKFAMGDGSGTYQVTGTDISITHNSPLNVFDSQGNRVVFENWQEGDFGIRLFDMPVQNAASTQDNIIYAQDKYDKYGPDVKINGNSGNDILYGTDGNDYLYGFSEYSGTFGTYKSIDDNGYLVFDSLPDYTGLDDDIIYAGDGDDWIWGDFGNDVLYGEAGTDVLFGGWGDDYIYGGDGSNYLQGGFGSDILIGGDEVDNIYGDELEGPGFRGLDGSVVKGKDDILYGGGGSDILVGAYGDDELYGGSEKDLLIGDGQDDESYGSGNDSLFGGEGDDELQGGKGDDRLFGEEGDDVLYGEEGNDFLSGGDGNDYIDADGLDLLPEQMGNDIIYGGAGYDWIYAGGGDDIVHGGDDDDQILGEDGVDRLFGDQGDDDVFGGNGQDTLYGGVGDDDLYGGADDDSLYGGDGNDVLDGGAGNDVLIGGKGGDTYIFGRGYGEDTILDSGDSNYALKKVRFRYRFIDGNITLVVGSLGIKLGDSNDILHIENFDPDNPFDNPVIGTFEFTDRTLSYRELLDIGFTIDGTDGDDVLEGTAVDDRLYGYAGNDTIIAKAGDDLLDGGSGADAMFGAEGDDTYILDNIGDTITEELDAGHDSVESSISYSLADNVEDLLLVGTDNIDATGNDLDNALTGNAGDNIITALGGNDQIIAGAGNDTIDAGSGNDSIDAGAGNDSIIAGAGSDRIHAGEGDDVVSAGSGNDSLFGEAGNDSLDGGAGRDYLDGGAGADALTGGAGDDVYVLDDAGDTVTELANGGIDTVSSSVSHSLGIHVENLQLTGYGAISGTGNELANRITGNDGDNIIESRGGNDYIDGGGGADQMTGGSGDDHYIVDNYGDTVTENLGEGTDSVESSVSFTLGAHIENLTLTGSGYLSGTGNDLDNVIIGNDSANTLTGLAGDDTIDGAAGDDTIFGNDGNDALYGGDDAAGAGGGEVPLFFDENEMPVFGNTNSDTIDGGAGDDTIDGGSGDDTLYGGAGNDYLYGGNDGAGSVPDWWYLEGGEGPPPGADSNRDYLDGGAGIDTLDGGTGDDMLYGRSGSDSLIGGTGNDLLDGGSELDSMAGGAGDDVYYVDGYSETVILPPDPGTDPGTDEGGTDSSACEAPLHDDDDEPEREKGNEGVGNGEDPPPPGHDENENDYAGTAPGQPGHKGGKQASSSDADDSSSADSGQEDDQDDHERDDHERDDDDHTGSDYEDGVCCEKGVFDIPVDSGSGASRTRIIWHTDTIVENAYAGYDTVYSSASFVLPDNVEELHLTGSADIDATGNAQDNRIYGNTGNNVLDGGAGSDELRGGAGDDTYVVDNLGDRIYEYLDEGIDTIRSSLDYSLTDSDQIENLTLVGNADLTGTGDNGDNTLRGNQGDNLLLGAGGNDVLAGGAGNDTLQGGVGDDIYLFNIGDGVDSLVDTEGVNIVRFGPGLGISNIAIRTEPASDGSTLAHLRLVDKYGNELDDQGIDFRLDAAGNLPVAGFEFSDGSTAGYEELLINQLEHTGTKRADVIETGRDDDTIYAGKGDDHIYAGGGNDTVYGEQGNDVLAGEAGHDRLYGGKGKDVLYGGAGADWLEGGAGHDLLNGGCDDDVLLGGDGNDELVGGHGNDMLHGGAGNDELKGGMGNDTYLVNLGDGEEEIEDYDATAANHDRLRFGDGIDAYQLIFEKDGDDLEIELFQPENVHDGHDDDGELEVEIGDWFEGSAHQIETIETSDGYQLLNSQVDQLIQAMATFGAENGGISWEEALQQHPDEAQALIAAYWQPV